jgi:hypothetical protein
VVTTKSTALIPRGAHATSPAEKPTLRKRAAAVALYSFVESFCVFGARNESF